jgi:ankyrin repeat protein
MESDIHDAVKADDGQAVKAIADADATAVNRVTAADGQVGLAPVHVAARHGMIEMTALLYGLGADLEVRDEEHQCTALGWAAYFDQAELAELLIRFGANLGDRCNPMQLAINNDCPKALAILKMYDDREETDE